MPYKDPDGKRKYYLQHAEERKAYTRKYYRRHKGSPEFVLAKRESDHKSYIKYRKERAISGKEYRMTHVDKIRKRERAKYLAARKRIIERSAINNLTRNYGLSTDDFNQMWLDQGGVCYLCHRVDERMLSVDHNHETGAVRHLLCRLCNLEIAAYESIVGRVGDTAVKVYLAEPVTTR